MNYKKLFMVSMLGGSILAGCASIDGFLENLGLKNTDKVVQVSITPINANYVFIKTANVRIAPSDTAMSLGTLNAGQRFFALGRTENNWIAISDTSGKRLGYVHASLVQKAGTKVSSTSKKKAKKTMPTVVKSSQKTTNNTENSTSSGVNLDDIPSKSSGSVEHSKSQGVNLDEL